MHNKLGLLIPILFVIPSLSSCFFACAQAQEEESSLAFENVDDINLMHPEHSRKELFLYVRERLCPSGRFSTVEAEQYVDLIEYGESVEFEELCRDTKSIYETESIYYKVTQNNPNFGEKVAVIMCKVNKDHSCFLDFKVILENEEQTGCLKWLKKEK